MSREPGGLRNAEALISLPDAGISVEACAGRQSGRRAPVRTMSGAVDAGASGRSDYVLVWWDGLLHGQRRAVSKSTALLLRPRTL